MNPNPNLRFLDILSTWHIGPIKEPLDVVRELIELFNDGPSHVRIYVGDNTFWEVTAPSCRFGDLSEIDMSDTIVEVGRHTLLPYPVGSTLFKHALMRMTKLEGAPYDYLELKEHLMDELGIDDKDDSNLDLWVCSSGAEKWVLTPIGYPFREDEELVSPQDIRLSKVYQMMWRETS